MVRLFIALLCAQPSADVVSVLYIEPGTRVELALTNTSDRPLSFVVREDGTVYGTEFGLIHNGETVEKVRSMVIQGPLASKEIQPGESLPCWMSTSYFYHSVSAANVDDSPQAPSLPRQGGRRSRKTKTITTGRYELIGRYKQKREQVQQQAVTPLNLPSRRLAILEIGGRLPFTLDEEVYPVRSLVREKAEIELLPVIRVSPAGRLEFAIANTSDQPLTFARNFEGNSVAGLEYTLLQDGETLATEPQGRPPYLAQVVAPGEALREVTSPTHFVPAPAPGRYELAVSYKMEAGQVDVDGVPVTPFEMPARVVAILEILPFERGGPRRAPIPESAAGQPDSDPSLPTRHFESE